jgi:hypothetical protein
MHMLPQETFREYFKNLVETISSSFSRLPFEYYESAWAAGSRVLAALRPARVDPVALQALVDAGGGNTPVLEGFRPKRSGAAHPILYDRFSTRTGRLTVTEGPNILTLKKEARGILRSVWEGGSIYSLDFRALEARVVLAEAGRSSTAGDMYAEIAEDLFGGRVPRDAVKTAVISELYGISRAALRLRLGVSESEVDGFISTIQSHFKVDLLRRRLKEEVMGGGRIMNRFGRKIHVPPDHDNLLVNSYAQSTGVDVAMLGFDAVLRGLGSEGIRPIFVLHDAIILDVAPERLEDVAHFVGVQIPGYEVLFPLKLENL